MMIKLEGIASEFKVVSPGAKASKAVRVVNPHLLNQNIIIDVYSRLVVSVSDEQALKTALKQLTSDLGQSQSPAYRPFSDTEDVFVIEMPSVENAITFANRLPQYQGVEWAEVEYQRPNKNDAITMDPSAADQWHVFDPSGNDHGVNLVYDQGYTGEGVVVGVLEAFQNSFYHIDENGTTFIHPDLVNKLNSLLSIPTDPFNISYSHGVSVAGLIGAEGNNGLYGSGVAYNAELASLKNGSSINSGESFSHALQSISIINNSWGPVNQTYPDSTTGKYLREFPDDFEIDIPQFAHVGLSRSDAVGLDRGIRLGNHRRGRIYVFSAGNESNFQTFERLATGNAVSLPGLYTDPGTLAEGDYGYLDITALDPSQTDADFNGLPDVFQHNPFDGATVLNWNWSGHFGDRVEYNQMASMSRTFAIASVGQSNTRSGYSTTGTSVIAGGYSQDFTLSHSFQGMGMGYGASAVGQGLVTLEQVDGVDQDGVDCLSSFGVSFADDDAQTCNFNGTSAAAPVASGIIALMLEANPNLSIRDIQHILQETSIPVNYDTTQSYWPSVLLQLGRLDPDDDPNNPSPTFWTTNSGNVRHSDEYGFGVIDADAAVRAAANWHGVGPLYVLDSGTVEAGEDNPNFMDGMIEDATFQPTIQSDDNFKFNRLIPGTRSIFAISCIRDNLLLEGVELTVTIDGDGAGDLLIALISPQGTVSPLALPRGDSNGLNGQAYTNYTFSTYKHWGELSGGTWQLVIQDFRPDTETPEGEPPTSPLPMDPEPEDYGVEQVTFLGTFGLPGEPEHSEKSLVSYRLKMFGTPVGEPVFEGCPPQLTSCPGDLDGSGIVDFVDLQIYVDWYLMGDARADLDGDGDVDYLDLLIFRSLWQPGYCDRSGFSGIGPFPSSSGQGPNDPIIRPI